MLAGMLFCRAFCLLCARLHHISSFFGREIDDAFAPCMYMHAPMLEINQSLIIHLFFPPPMFESYHLLFDF